MSGIPEGFHTLTPCLALKGASRAIEMYQKAFGAEIMHRLDTPDGSGKVAHACLKIGDSMLMLADEMPGCPAREASLYLYFKDADAAFEKAKKAGMSEHTPMQDMFWGDRFGAVQDGFGVTWSIATQISRPSQQELERGAKDMFERMKKSKAA